MMSIGDYVKIGGRAWNVRVTAIAETFAVLYSENNGRTLGDGAPMVLDPLGTCYGHKVTFERVADNASEYDMLFDYLSRPRNAGIPVEIVHNQTTISYDAYVTSGNRALRKIRNSGVVDWEQMEIEFVPIRAQVTT